MPTLPIGWNAHRAAQYVRTQLSPSSFTPMIKEHLQRRINSANSIYPTRGDRRASRQLSKQFGEQLGRLIRLTRRTLPTQQVYAYRAIAELFNTLSRERAEQLRERIECLQPGIVTCRRSNQWVATADTVLLRVQSGLRSDSLPVNQRIHTQYAPEYVRYAPTGRYYLITETTPIYATRARALLDDLTDSIRCPNFLIQSHLRVGAILPVNVTDNTTHYYTATEPPMSDPIGPYSSARPILVRTNIPDWPGNAWVGFELEWVPPDSQKRTSIVIGNALKDSCPMGGQERDGSLRAHNGAEIVSHFGPMPIITAHARLLTSVLRKHKALSQKAPCSCGLHVNLSRDGVTEPAICRFIVFWHSATNREFLRKFARRWNEIYCQTDPNKTEQLIKAGLGRLRNINRNELVNLQSEGRIEVRAFRGTTGYQTLRACLDLSWWLLRYCEDTTIHRLRPKLSYLDFLKWCQSDRATRSYTDDARKKSYTPKATLAYAKRHGIEIPPSTRSAVSIPPPPPEPEQSPEPEYDGRSPDQCNCDSCRSERIRAHRESLRA